MASPALRLDENVAGDFYVDSTCIDCDACRVFAPTVFSDAGAQSFVFHQPATAEELLAARKAQISCPTSSIGSSSGAREAIDALPELIDDDVYRCGYTAESSFGAISYLIGSPVIPSEVEGSLAQARDSSPIGGSLAVASNDTGGVIHLNEAGEGSTAFIRLGQPAQPAVPAREDTRGNILIDSPRFARPLAKRLGSVRRMLLTHQDDIADHAKFREHFGCERVLHRDDARGRTFESMPEGLDPIDLGDGILMIPTPGHTKGHAVFLYREKFLFTGDHLAWSESRGHLYAFRSACWYSWSEQIRSMERLRAFRFEWVLPGHGRPIRLSAGEMERSLERCVHWMRAK